MSEWWYNKYWRDKETPEFVEWVETEYGKPKDYQNTIREQDEYWVRRGFALMGWHGNSTLRTKALIEYIRIAGVTRNPILDDLVWKKV